MTSNQNDYSSLEKRQFERLKLTLPIEFTIVRLQGDLPGIDWQKGRTRNVSQGGLGLETGAVSESTIVYMGKQNVLLELKITVPGRESALRVVGEVAWHEKKGEQYLIGLRYHSIKSEDRKELLSLVAS